MDSVIQSFETTARNDTEKAHTDLTDLYDRKQKHFEKAMSSVGLESERELREFARSAVALFNAVNTMKDSSKPWVYQSNRNVLVTQIHQITTRNTLPKDEILADVKGAWRIEDPKPEAAPTPAIH